jgi:hypothetical protein
VAARAAAPADRLTLTEEESPAAASAGAAVLVAYDSGMSTPDSAADYVRVINGVRLELETAGNPAYLAVVVTPGGELLLSPVVYATIAPAAEHAVRMSRDLEPGEQVHVVSRSAAGRRAMFTVVEPRTLKKLHQRLEVIEESFAESDGPI